MTRVLVVVTFLALLAIVLSGGCAAFTCLPLERQSLGTEEAQCREWRSAHGV